MSESLPIVQLPENVNQEDENWKGIDLKPLSPILFQYLDEGVTFFPVPIGDPIAPFLTEPLIEKPGSYISDGSGCMDRLELRTYLIAEVNGPVDPLSSIPHWES